MYNMVSEMIEFQGDTVLKSEKTNILIENTIFWGKLVYYSFSNNLEENSLYMR